MKVIYTEQCLQSLEESLFFLLYEQKIPAEKVKQILDELLSRAEELSANPYIGQVEDLLEHLKLGHRRVIKDKFKIIYRIDDESIFITDFFDTRQDPTKMKG
jgi:plasmid stabilization system protein ParE